MAFTLTKNSADLLQRAISPETVSVELVTLAASKDPEVRAAVVARKDCPMATMVTLATDADQRVLWALVDNPRAPQSALETLLESRFPAIRMEAKAKLSQR